MTDLVPGGTDESATDRASERYVLDRQTYQAMEKLAADAGCSVSDVACFALTVVVHRLGIDPDDFGMAADTRELLGLGEVSGPFGQVFPLAAGVTDSHCSGAAALHRWAQRLAEARSMLGVPALAQGSGQAPPRLRRHRRARPPRRLVPGVLVPPGR